MDDAAFAEPRRRGRPPKIRGEGMPEVEDGEVLFQPEPVPRRQPIDDGPDPNGLGPAYEAPMPSETPGDVTIPKGWYNLKDAPDSGKAIWLMGPEGEMSEAVWRHTRKYDPVGGKWRIIAFWAVHNAGGTRVMFEPVCWKPL